MVSVGLLSLDTAIDMRGYESDRARYLEQVKRLGVRAGNVLSQEINQALLKSVASNKFGYALRQQMAIGTQGLDVTMRRALLKAISGLGAELKNELSRGMAGFDPQFRPATTQTQPQPAFRPSTQPQAAQTQARTQPQATYRPSQGVSLSETASLAASLRRTVPEIQKLIKEIGLAPQEMRRVAATQQQFTQAGVSGKQLAALVNQSLAEQGAQFSVNRNQLKQIQQQFGGGGGGRSGSGAQNPVAAMLGLKGQGDALDFADLDIGKVITRSVIRANIATTIGFGIAEGITKAILGSMSGVKNTLSGVFDAVIGDFTGGLKNAVLSENVTAQVRRATSMETERLGMASAISTIGNTSLSQGRQITQDISAALAKVAAVEVGEQNQYMDLLTMIGDDLVRIFVNDQGKLDSAASQRFVGEGSELIKNIGLVAASSGNNAAWGSGAMAVSSLLGGASLQSLRRLDFFERYGKTQYNELDRIFQARGITELTQLDRESQLKVLNSAFGLGQTEERKQANANTLDAVIQENKAKLFDASSGIFSIQRDLGGGTIEQPNTVFESIKTTVKETILFVEELVTVMGNAGLSFGDPMVALNNVVTSLNAAIVDAKSNLAAFFATDTGQQLISIINQLKDGLAALPGFIGNTIATFGPAVIAITDAVVQAMAVILPLGQQLSATFAPLITAGAEVASAFIVQALTTAQDILPGLIDMASQFVAPLVDKGMELADRILPSAQSAASALFVVFQGLWDITTQLLATAQAVFVDVMGDPRTGEMVNGIAQTMGDMLVSMGEMLAMLGSALTFLSEQQWLWDAIAEITSTQIKGTLFLIDNVLKAINGLIKLQMGFFKDISSTVSGISGTANTLNDQFGSGVDLIGQMTSGFKLFAQAIKLALNPAGALGSKLAEILGFINGGGQAAGGGLDAVMGAAGTVGSADTYVGAVLSILEAGETRKQGQIDVAQAIANRVANNYGGYGRSIRDQAFAPGQFQPFFSRAQGGYGIGRGDIVDRESAADALMKARRIGKDAALQLIDEFMANLGNQSMVQAAQSGVKNRQNFKGTTQYGNMRSTDFLRQQGDNFFHYEDDAREARMATGNIRDVFASQRMTGSFGASNSAAARVLAAAENNLGLFAGTAEQCANAMRELFKETNIGVGVTKKAWDGLESSAALASSFFGDDIGQRINRQQDLRPGDLIGFEQTYGNWGKGVQTHVGVYAGDGMMYDHSSKRGLVKRPVDTFKGKFMYGVRPYAYGAADGTRNFIPVKDGQGRTTYATSGGGAGGARPSNRPSSSATAAAAAASPSATASGGGGEQRMTEEEIKRLELVDDSKRLLSELGIEQNELQQQRQIEDLARDAARQQQRTQFAATIAGLGSEQQAVAAAMQLDQDLLQQQQQFEDQVRSIERNITDAETKRKRREIQIQQIAAEYNQTKLTMGEKFDISKLSTGQREQLGADPTPVIEQLNKNLEQLKSLRDATLAPTIEKINKAARDQTKALKEMIKSQVAAKAQFGDTSAELRQQIAIDGINERYDELNKQIKNQIAGAKQQLLSTNINADTRSELEAQLKIAREQGEKLGAERAAAIAKSEREFAIQQRNTRTALRDQLLGTEVSGIQAQAESLQKYNPIVAAELRKRAALINLAKEQEAQQQAIEDQRIERLRLLSTDEGRSLLQSQGLGSEAAINAQAQSELSVLEQQGRNAIAQINDQMPTVADKLREQTRDAFSGGIKSGLMSIINGGEFNFRDFVQSLLMPFINQGIDMLTQNMGNALFGGSEEDRGLLGAMETKSALDEGSANAANNLIMGAQQAKAILTGIGTSAAPVSGIGAIMGDGASGILSTASGFDFGDLTGGGGFNIADIFGGGAGPAADSGITETVGTDIAAAFVATTEESDLGGNLGKGFGSVLGSLFGGGGGGSAVGGILGTIGNILGFERGGVVPGQNHQALRSLPGIGDALRREGPNAIIAALSPGEMVLSRSQVRALRSGGAASLIPNYKDGTTPGLGGGVVMDTVKAQVSNSKIQQSRAQSYKFEFKQVGSEQYITVDQAKQLEARLNQRSDLTAARAAETVSNSLRGDLTYRRQLGVR